jgi:hypothetical protein
MAVVVDGRLLKMFGSPFSTDSPKVLMPLKFRDVRRGGRVNGVPSAYAKCILLRWYSMSLSACGCCMRVLVPSVCVCIIYARPPADFSLS